MLVDVEAGRPRLIIDLGRRGRRARLAGALAALAVEGAKQADAMTGTLDSQVYGVAHHEDFPLR